MSSITNSKNTDVKFRKNIKRHIVCLTNYKPKVFLSKITARLDNDESQKKRPDIPGELLTSLWEEHVLAQLSEDTRTFIKARFEVKDIMKINDHNNQSFRERIIDDFSAVNQSQRLFQLIYEDFNEPELVIIF